MPIYNGNFSKEIGQAIKPFSEYNKEMEDFLISDTHSINIDAVSSLINGKANESLRTLVPIDIRRNAGVFFTNKKLADKVAAHIKPILKNGGKAVDPALGAGNLILACSECLPPQLTLKDTLTLWSNSLKGCELYPEMVMAARLRLLFSAALHHPDEINRLANLKLNDYFNDIRTGDAFKYTDILTDSCIVVNPPFGHMETPADCDWTTGQVQIAAWFMDKLLPQITPGQHIVAVLPDVLRSGTRYNRWRTRTAQYCSSIWLESAGRFDKEADVDVFIFHAIVKSSDALSCEWPRYISEDDDQNTKTLSDYFDVHVGSIVPHRDPDKGQWQPFLHARTAKQGQKIEKISNRMRTRKRLFKTPFVAVHRTSSPSDKCRCVASIVNSVGNVAVENHLIVLLPKNGSLKSCEELIIKLQDKRTNSWINNRIRCRHLTVSSLEELPWWS